MKNDDKKPDVHAMETRKVALPSSHWKKLEKYLLEQINDGVKLETMDDYLADIIDQYFDQIEALEFTMKPQPKETAADKKAEEMVRASLGEEDVKEIKEYAKRKKIGFADALFESLHVSMKADPKFNDEMLRLFNEAKARENN